MNERSARIIAIEGDAVGNVWTKTCGVGIGRSVDNTLSFPADDALEQEHASLLFTGNEWICKSYPPAVTYLDNDLIEAPKLVRSGSVLRCGRQAFLVVYWEEGTEYQGSLMQGVDDGLVQSAQDKVGEALRAFLASRGP